MVVVPVKALTAEKRCQEGSLPLVESTQLLLKNLASCLANAGHLKLTTLGNQFYCSSQIAFLELEILTFETFKEIFGLNCIRFL